MTTLRDIGVAAIVNIGLTIWFLLSFVFLSVQPVNDRVYYPKLYIMGVRKGRPRASPSQLRPIEKYFNFDFGQYMGLFEWAKSALRKTENEIIQHAGLDSAVFLRIFLVGLKIFVPLMIMGMAILVPVNIGAGSLAESGTSSVDANTTTTKFLFSSIDKLSMSNVPNQSPRLWAHLVMSYVFTAWVCFILFMEYKSIAALRLKFLSDEKRRPDQFTVMVLQIPDHGVQPLDKQVEIYFRRNHPDFYLTHQMAYNANKLSKIVLERDKAENWLVYFQNKHKRNPTMRPKTKTGFCGTFGEQVDAIDYYAARIEKLTLEAEEERQVVINDPKATMPAALVSFRNRWGTAVCAQTQQNQDPTLWLTEWAPEPRDVYWANLSIPYVQIGFRKLIAGGVVFLTVFFYMIPITAVQSLANLEGLRRSIPSLDGFLQKSFAASFVQGFLPGLLLKICFHLLPRFIMFLAKLEGHLSISKLERRAAAKYYYFVVVNIFFGSILAGSAFQQLKTFVTSSSVLGFINTLALSIPQKASFFITYIMVDGWSGPAGEILGLSRLVKYHIKNALFCKTEKDRLAATSPGTLGFDQTLPQLQLYFLMGLVYSVITPVIIPFIIIFMGFAFLVYRYQVINVYDPEYESAGAFWPHVHGRIIAALILEHITLIGIFLIKGPVAFVRTSPGGDIKSQVLRYVRDSCSSTPFMIALPILTLVFHHYCKKRFEAAFKNYPLENAMEKDMQDRRDEPGLNLAVLLQNAYNHPDFSDEQENADVEKGQGKEGVIEEDDKIALHDSLPARTVDDFVERGTSEVERDSSPLLYQAAKDVANQDSASLDPSVSLRRRSSSRGGTSLARKLDSSLQEDNVEGRGSDKLGGYQSARNHFVSASSHGILDRGIAASDTDSSSSSAEGHPTTDGADSTNELHSLQRYLRAQLSRENSFVESLQASDETTSVASLLTNSTEFAMRNDTEAAALGDFQPHIKRQLSRENSTAGEPIEDDIDKEASMRIAYLQGYLRGQLSRQNSSAEPSPLTLKRRSSYKDGNEEEDGDNLAGSPLTFKRGMLVENDVADGDEIISASYLQGYVKGQLSRENSGRSSPSFTDSPGSPLTFRTGKFGKHVDSRESQDMRTSPLRGASPLSQRVLRAQTMSTITETSEMLSDAQRGHFSRAKTFGLTQHATSPSSSLSKEGEISSQAAEIVLAPLIEVSQPVYARAKSLGSLREVIYLDSPSFERPNLARAKTLATMLKEPQDKSNRGPASKVLRQRKLEKEMQPSQKSTTKSKSSRGHASRAKKLDSARESDPEASTSVKPRVSRASSLKNLMKNDPDDQPPTTLQLRRKISSERKLRKEDRNSSSSSSSPSSSSSSSSSDIDKKILRVTTSVDPLG